MSKKFIVFAAAASLLFAAHALGASIRNTRHNLSVSGPGEIRAADESRICISCHTPHNPGQDTPYLWNRRDSTVNYTTYMSSTLDSTAGQPTGTSKLCLSCHDGTIALGAVTSRRREIPFRGGIRFMPQGRQSRLGTDLSDDHPVSIVYDTGLAMANRELARPRVLPAGVRLDERDQVQCTTCHNPHDDTFDKFLVMSNRFSGLCTSCHRKEGWAASSHARSNAPLPAPGSSPWSGTNMTVAENGCQNCHAPHMAGGPERLMNYSFEEDNCLVCHNGSGEAPDIEATLLKRSRHPVQDYTGLHDPNEDFAAGQVPRHVECVDCHNPHTANGDPPLSGSTVSGAGSGVKGMNAGGQITSSARNGYEICFKCHAGQNFIGRLTVSREEGELNIRHEFNPANASFHPVVAPGAGLDAPSLLSPYSINSAIACTDCHNTDSTNGAKGPHGSIYEHLLEKNYETLDYTTESAYAYALCYKCHSRNSILSDESFGEHRRHIVDEKAPCALCHDPHGSVNRGRLINFSLTSVLPDEQGRLDFQESGMGGEAECFLTCHGKTHRDISEEGR